MGKSAKYNKPIRSENENVIRRENGSIVLRKEKVFTDGSRLVEESFIEGSELQTRSDVEQALPLVSASVYDPSSGSARRGAGAVSSNSSDEMLQPTYDPNGNLYGVVAMMILRYGWCGFCTWSLVRILQRIAANRAFPDDDDGQTGTAFGSTYGGF